MAKIVCELCGSDTFVKTDGMFVCQGCNTGYTPDEAREMMVGESVEVSAPISAGEPERRRESNPSGRVKCWWRLFRTQFDCGLYSGKKRSVCQRYY